MASSELKAFTLLLAAGFLAGYGFSGGVGRYYGGSAPRHTTSEGAGQEGAGGGGGGKHGAAQEGGAAREGSQGDHAGATQAGGPGPSPRERNDKDAPGAGGAAPEPVAKGPDDEENRALLAGNTLRGDQPDAARDRYLSPRGWQGVGERNAFVVHRWAVHGGQFCLLDIGAPPACEAATIVRVDKPRIDRGTVLGTMTLGSGARLTILRGNLTGLPETIPLIDAIGVTPPAALGNKPTQSGPAVQKAMLGLPLSTLAHSPEDRSGYVFDPDGDWIVAHPIIGPQGVHVGGLRIAIGRWATRDGDFCLDEPGLDLARTCYQPQQWGTATFRLVPTRSGSPLDIAVIAGGA